MENKVLEILNVVSKNKNRLHLTVLDQSLHLRQDIGYDSLDLAEFAVRIEAEFDIDLFKDGVVNTIEEVMIKLKGV